MGGTVGQEAVELICQNARKTRQNQTLSLWPLLSTKMKLIWIKVSNKIIFSQKTWFLVNFCPKNLHFITLHLYNPKNLSQTDITQWDHISPISFSVFFLTLLFNRNLATLALFPNGSPIKIVIVMYVHFYCLLNDRVPYFIFMSSAICGSAPRQCWAMFTSA